MPIVAEDFYGHPGIATGPALTAGAEMRQDLVRTDFCAGSERHDSFPVPRII